MNYILLNAAQVVTVDGYYVLAGGLLLSALTVVSGIIGRKSSHNTTMSLYEEKMKNFCSTINHSIESLKDSLTTDIESLRVETREILEKHGSVLKNIMRADKTILKYQDIYSSFIRSTKDYDKEEDQKLLGLLITCNYEKTVSFIKEIIHMGFEGLCYDAVVQKINARAEEVFHLFDTHTNSTDFKDIIHKEYSLAVERYISEIRPVFDPQDRAFKYNNRMLLFLNESQTFFHKTSVMVMVEFDEYIKK